MIAALAMTSMSASAPQRIDILDDEERLPKLPPRRTAVHTSVMSSGINRHTGEPHEHRREIARRLRQKARGEQ